MLTGHRQQHPDHHPAHDQQTQAVSPAPTQPGRAGADPRPAGRALMSPIDFRCGGY